MAVISVPGQSRLQFRLIVGQDGEGNYILRTRSFGRIKPDTSDEDAHLIGAMLMDLQQHEVLSVHRSDSAELIPEG